MNNEAVWHGTPEQRVELAKAVAHNCACECGGPGSHVLKCAAHAILENQRMLDGLVFSRHMVERLVAREFDSSQIVSTPGPAQLE